MGSTEQPDTAKQLAAVRHDRDSWQARAVQAEGQASNLAKQLVEVRGELRKKTQQWIDRVQQVSDLANALQLVIMNIVREVSNHDE